MKTLLHMIALIALFALLSNVPVVIAGQPMVAPVATDIADNCTRKSRRPIAEVVSGRCTEEDSPHYVAETLPECDCLLEQDKDGLTVLRLSLPVQPLPQVKEESAPAVPAVFRRQLADASHRAHIL